MKTFALPLSALIAAFAAAQQPNLDRDPTLYVVGYAHLDTEWRWSYDETIKSYLPATLKDNFRLFEKYPNYVFNFTGSNRYRLMKEYYPADYERMKKYIAQGRWFPGGSSVEEGDVNSPSLESLIRQVLYGNRYFKQEFGKESSEYMLPDCFGFPAALPSILAHCGIKGFSTQKLTWGSAVGIPFNLGVWEGPDGRSVVAALNPDNYVGTIEGDLTTNQKWYDRVRANGEKSGVFADYKYFGTGDMGGAPEEKSVINLEKSLAGKGPLKVLGGTSARLFDDLTAAQIAKLPRYKGDLELTQHSAGSLTSLAEIKRLNHENEKLAHAAEAACVAGSLLGNMDYPSERLREAWNFFLPGQFHDLMAGTALPKAYDYALNDEFIALNQFGSLLKEGVSAVAENLDCQTKGIPVVVFNPISFDREDPVELVVTYPAAAPKDVHVIGPDGNLVDSQVLSQQSNRIRLLIRPKLAGLSFSVFDVRTGLASRTHKSATPAVIGHTIENERFQVHVADSGNIDSIIERQSGRQLLAAPIRMAFMHENPRDYPAWNMDWEDQKKPPYWYLDGPAKITQVESGIVRGALQIERQAQGSKFVQIVRLSAGSDRIEFFDKIDWKTSETALKVSFPLVASNPMATYNEQLGTIQRGNNEPKKYEVLSHEWFDLTDKSGTHGASVLTVDKFGSDKPSDNELRLTLLYTPGVQGGYEDQATQDWGHHEIRYGLVPHEGNWTATTPSQAVQLDQPCVAFQVAPHAGKIGRTYQLAAVNAPNVSIVSVKRAEDALGIIVRLRENAGQTAIPAVVLNGSAPISSTLIDGQERVIGSEMPAQMAPYEARAYLLAGGAVPSQYRKQNSVALPFNTDVVSSNQNRGNGNVAPLGVALPAEAFPASVSIYGVDFRLGSSKDGANNAVRCSGQEITIPAGTRLHLLAASANGPKAATFGFGSKSATLSIGRMTGYIGRWDTRSWNGTVEDVAYGWRPTFAGLEPAYLQPDPIAKVFTHLHGVHGDLVYQYGYLYNYSLEVPKGAKSIRLPKDPSINIFAMTTTDDSSVAQLASPEPESFVRALDAPEIVAPPKTENAVLVSLKPRLYGSEKNIRYSIDGAKSQPYTGPFWVAKTSTLRAQFGTDGPATSAKLEVNDSRKPQLLATSAWERSKRVVLQFSEPVRDAANPAHYVPAGPLAIQSVKVSNFGTKVELSLKSNSGKGPLKLRLQGLVDTSPQRNKVASPDLVIQPKGPIIAGIDFDADGQTLERHVDGLPTAGDSPWTLSFDVKMDKEPEALTPIAGFGESSDSTPDGTARYVCEFEQGIHFWGRNVDVPAGARFKLHEWQTIKVTYDGTLLSIYRDGVVLKRTPATLGTAKRVLKIAPPDGWDRKRKFRGQVRNLEIWDEVV